MKNKLFKRKEELTREDIEALSDPATYFASIGLSFGALVIDQCNEAGEGGVISKVSDDFTEFFDDIRKKIFTTAEPFSEQQKLYVNFIIYCMLKYKEKDEQELAKRKFNGAFGVGPKEGIN